MHGANEFLFFFFFFVGAGSRYIVAGWAAAQSSRDADQSRKEANKSLSAAIFFVLFAAWDELDTLDNMYMETLTTSSKFKLNLLLFLNRTSTLTAY